MKVKSIVFLYHPKARLWGSVRARVIQMAGLVTEMVIESGFDISVKTDIDGIQDSLVVIHKTIMNDGAISIIPLLKTRNCILVADPVDGKFNKDDFSVYDAVISASFAQIDWLSKVLLNKKTYFVNQRIDSRFPTFNRKDNELLKIGYFGAAENCAHKEHVTGLIDIVETPTDKPEWMNRLQDYDMHYVVRPHVEGVFKPFGKGYIAGRYSCPIIVGRDEPDASHLLPPDYPYWVDSSDSNSICDVITKAQSEFKSESWLYAQECLEKISHLATDDTITSQFSSMIEDLVKSHDKNKNPKIAELFIKHSLKRISNRACRLRDILKNKIKKTLN